MEINIHHIPEEGLKIDSSLPADILEVVDGERITGTTPVICEMMASLSNTNLIVRGEATVILDCKCDRCLEKAEVPVHAEDICIVVEDSPDIVDLTNDIREDILLAFPQIYLCEEDCKGLCFSCGKNLNKEECQCDCEQENNSPWDTLDKIEFKDSSGE